MADSSTSAPQPPMKKARTEADAEQQTQMPASRHNYFATQDIVWVHPAKGFPLWPAEIVRVCDKSSTQFDCKLIAPLPKPDLTTVTNVHATKLIYFDHLSSDQLLTDVIEARLQRKKHDVSGYEAGFKEAVANANAMVRVVLNAATLRQTGTFTVAPVGIVHCFFRSHCDAPRQPHSGVTPQTGVIRVAPGFENGLRDLKGFDWIWVVFHFSFSTGIETSAKASEDAPSGEDGSSPAVVGKNQPQQDAFKCMVVPPRDTKARGVFATRSPHRPNSIGLSCVRLVDVRGLEVHIADHDLLHGTPVLDIKPYLPFCDAHPDAKAGWVDALNRSGKSLGDHRPTGNTDYLIHRVPQASAAKPSTTNDDDNNEGSRRKDE